MESKPGSYIVMKLGGALMRVSAASRATCDMLSKALVESRYARCNLNGLSAASEFSYIQLVTLSGSKQVPSTTKPYCAEVMEE